jgi:hypothetical protein
MTLISQPGSDYQIAAISLDAGYTRDLILMLTDVHAVLDHLYLDGTQPQITAPAEDYLRETASPYTLPAWRASHFPDCGSFRILDRKGREIGGEIQDVFTRVQGGSRQAGH